MSQVSPSLRATFLPSPAPGQCPGLTLKLRNKLRDSLWSPPFSLTQKTPLAPLTIWPGPSECQQSLPLSPTPSEDPTGTPCSKLFGVQVSGVRVENQEEEAPGAPSVGRATWLGGGGQPTPIRTHLRRDWLYIIWTHLGLRALPGTRV